MRKLFLIFYFLIGSVFASSDDDGSWKKHLTHSSGKATRRETAAEQSPSLIREAPTIKFGQGLSLRPVRDTSAVPAFLELYHGAVIEHYEDGLSWDEEKATRRILHAGPRVQSWEEGNNHTLPWTLIYLDDQPIGTFMAAFGKSEKFPKHVEIACALKEVFWGQKLSLQAAMAYSHVYLLPLLDELEGIHATADPQNVKSCRAMNRVGFEQVGEPFTVEGYGVSERDKPQRVDYVLPKAKLTNLLQQSKLL